MNCIGEEAENTFSVSSSSFSVAEGDDGDVTPPYDYVEKTKTFIKLDQETFLKLKAENQMKRDQETSIKLLLNRVEKKNENRIKSINVVHENII